MVRRGLAIALMLMLARVVQGQPSISGRVVNATTGFGIVGIDLDVFDARGSTVATTGTLTGVEGRYTFLLPGAGSYFVRADPSLADFFVDQYYSNVFLRAEAALIRVESFEVVTNINFSLRSGFQLQGFVRSLGVGLADVDLDLYAENGEFLSGYPGRTRADGSFTLGVLPPGTYYLRAQPDVALGQLFVPAYYGGAQRLPEAAPIVVTSSDVSSLVLDLVPGGGIAGQVVDRVTTTPLANIDLDLYDTNHVRLLAGALTDTNGNFVLGPLPVGRYLLRADPTIEQGYARTYYSNSFFRATSQPIEVQAGKMTTGVSLAPERAGAVAGRIVDATSGEPIAGIDLNAHDLATNRFDVFASSDTNGNFVLGPLPVGAYWIRAEPDPGMGHLPQYYQLATNTIDATPVAVSAGWTSSNINFQLGPAGWIEGVVSNRDGLPLSGIDLDLYDGPTGTRLTLGATTSSNGLYRIGPLPAGSYTLRCDPAVDQGYAVQYFDGKLARSLADLLLVTNSAGTSNITFTLEPGGHLAGRVVAADTGLPLSALDVDVLQTGNLLRFDQSASTDVEGRFDIGPFPAGTYTLRVDPSATSTYLRTYYGDTESAAAALPILLAAPGAVSNLNIRVMAKRPPVITTQLQTQTAVVGSNVTFIVGVNGTSPLSYQWWHGHTLLQNANSSILVLNGVKGADAGTYSVVVTNLVGQTNSVAVLTVIEPSVQPRLQLSFLSTSMLRIALAAPAGQRYQLETRTNLVTGVWTADGVPLTNITGNVNWDVPVAGPESWYRVGTQ